MRALFLPSTIRGRLITFVALMALAITVPSVHLGVALLTTAVATAIAWWFSTKLVAPLITLRDATRELAAGKLDRRVTVTGSEEIRSLGAAFNDMAARLEQLIAGRYRVESELRHARNEALQASRLKSGFLATMSHEIRTPMNGVLGMIALLRDSRLDDEQRDYTDTIQSSAEHLLAIINDILDFSKIEAGKLILEQEDFELRPNIEAMVELFAPAAQGRGLEVVCSIAPDVPQVVKGDLARVRQIVANLTGNAVKFTERGEVVVRVEVESRRPDTVRLAFAVSDTGIGISASAQKNLFQPFVQADSSHNRRYGGTGLGIAISKQLIETMHGRIRVDSTEGVGSVFSFTIELGCSEPRVVPKRTVHELSSTVAVLEPNVSARKCLRDELEWLGYEVHAFDSLRAFIESGEHPSLIMIEPRLWGSAPHQGLEGLRRISELESIPVVLTQPLAQRIGLEKALRQPNVMLLKKPIRAAALANCLEHARGVACGEEPPSDEAPTTEIQVETPAIETQPAPIPTARRVLVAEDNVVNQRVVLHMLKRLGLEPTLVPNGFEAVKEVSKGVGYEYVFMDVQMPEMDGYEATAEIRKLEPRIKRVPIFAMTANALPGDRNFCLAAGMDDYVSKPLTMQALAELIARWPRDQVLH